MSGRVRTDPRRVEGVGAGGGQPGSNAKEGRSLHSDRHVDVELPQGGGSTTPTDGRTIATGGAARSSGGVILRINRRRKTPCIGCE
jgi:hypothetical protein